MSRRYIARISEQRGGVNVSDKEDKARELAGTLCGRANLKVTLVGSWEENELYDWLQCMGYTWDGESESWYKSS
jgi:hypothetical protein